MMEMGCYEVSLGDTIGRGTPGETSQNTMHAHDILLLTTHSCFLYRYTNTILPFHGDHCKKENIINATRSMPHMVLHVN